MDDNGLADDLLRSLAQNEAKVNPSPALDAFDQQAYGNEANNYSEPNNDPPPLEESYFGGGAGEQDTDAAENLAHHIANQPSNDAFNSGPPTSRPGGPLRPPAAALNRNANAAYTTTPLGNRMTPSNGSPAFGTRVAGAPGGVQPTPFGVRPPTGAQGIPPQRQGTLFQVPGRFATAQRPFTQAHQLRQGRLPFQAPMNSNNGLGRPAMSNSRPSVIPVEMGENTAGPIGGGNQAVRLDSDVYVNPAQRRYANQPPAPSANRRHPPEQQPNRPSRRRREEDYEEEEFEDSLQGDDYLTPSQSLSYRDDDEYKGGYARRRSQAPDRDDRRRGRYAEGAAARRGMPRRAPDDRMYEEDYSGSVGEGSRGESVSQSEGEYRQERRRDGRRNRADAAYARPGRRDERERRRRYEREPEYENDDEEEEPYEYEAETFAQPRAPPRSSLTSRPPAHAPGAAADGLSEFNPPNAPTIGNDHSLAMRRLQLQEEQKRRAEEEQQRQLELARRQQQQQQGGQSTAAAATASKQDGSKEGAAAKDQKDGKQGLLKSIFNQQNKVPIIVISVTVAVALVIIGVMIVLSRSKKKAEEEQSSRSKSKQYALPSSSAPIVPEQQVPEAGHSAAEYTTAGGSDHVPGADFSYPSARDLPPLSNADFIPPQHSSPSFQQQPQQSFTSPYNPNIPQQQQQQQQQQQYYQDRPAPAAFVPPKQPPSAQEQVYPPSHDTRQQQDPRLTQQQQQYNTNQTSGHDATPSGNKGYYAQQPRYAGGVHSPLISQSKQLPVFD